MSTLRVQGLSKYFGDTLVFEGVSFSLAGGERVGLVGPNGSGKTTLLRILAGQELFEEGSVDLPSSATTGFLCQDLDLPRGLTLWELARGAFEHVHEMGRRLSDLEQQMSLSGDDTGVLERYGHLRERFEHAGGYSWETTTSAVLGGLGFSRREWDQSLDTMSGGERVRAGLARLLLDEPDLLLLDEPTNHLDWDALTWLEGFLGRYPGALLVVSHDRYFLDRAVGRILALEAGRVESYRGNYSAYRLQRSDRVTRAGKDARLRDQESESLRAYIRRYKAGNRSRQARSREKRLERLEEEARRERPPPPKPRDLRVNLDVSRSSGREVLHLENVGHGFCGRTLFRGLSGLIRRGQRVGLVGPNGAGKSTLLRIMGGMLEPSEGRVRPGAGVLSAYLGQDLGLEDEERPLWRELAEEFGLTIPEARHHLAAIGFTGEEYQKRVGDLSGGERTKLIIRKLAMSGSNLLLLDEPTNHLDIDARQALEDALHDYRGTVIAVSHDRALLSMLATRLLVFDGAAGVRWFDGTFDDWVAASSAGPGKAVRVDGERRPGRSPSRGRTANSYLKEAEEIEQEIARLSEVKDLLELKLADPDTYKDGGGAEVVREHREVSDTLEDLYRRWETALD